MAKHRTYEEENRLQDLLTRDHSLNGAILHGLAGYLVEIQARAIHVLPKPKPWAWVTTISGMAKGAISEVLDRISGAFAKLSIPSPEVEILINLVPADLEKEGTWLDLPIAIILLQAAGILPDLPEHLEGEYVLNALKDRITFERAIPKALDFGLIKGQDRAKEAAYLSAAGGHNLLLIGPPGRTRWSSMAGSISANRTCSGSTT
jgi:magnesium chelatase family protein